MGGGIGSILYTERAGLREHFTYNAVGDTVALTRNNGNVKKTDLYEAFGNIVSSTGSSDNNRLANTKERSFTFNLDNHGMRYYDPEVGRYLTRDPLGYGDGLNCYLYVHNNPINHVDPLGLAGEGLLYSWLANKIEEGAQNTSSPALAATASLASQALNMGAGYDPQYTSYQANQRVSQEIQEHGVREAMGMELVRARTTVEESVGTSDIVRAVDSEGKYSAGERVWYGVQGASKTFLTVMGGMSLAGKSTPAVAAGEKPPPLPAAAAVEMAPEASAAAKEIPPVIYRGGKPSPSNLKLRPGEEALSFRDSLSNPLPKTERPVFRPGDDFHGIDTSKLPPGSVVPDNIPPGHVSVQGVTHEQLQQAVIERGKFPK